MLHHIQQLAAIAQQPQRNIIGLMSGTSLDGLDVAWCTITGSGQHTQVVLRAFHSEPYDAAFKAEIRRVFAKKEVDFQHLTLLNAIIAERHAAIIKVCLEKWGLSHNDIDLIASHGQTVFHAPRVLHGLDNYPNATLQIGDGDHIARRTGIITISDFRQKHVAAGGEGAPLALYGDYFLFSSPEENRILLNMGGISNFTWLPGTQDTTAIFATDTGPGNTLLDAFARRLFDAPFDRDALFASAGVVDQGLVDILKSDPFFQAPFPKTTGPELFSAAWVDAALEKLPKGMPAHNPYNLMASLTALTAQTIAEAVQKTATGKGGTIYASGGGANNPLIISLLKDMLPNWKIAFMQELGIPGDAKEAVLFAVLANECVAGKADYKALSEKAPAVSMGKISLPG